MEGKETNGPQYSPQCLPSHTLLVRLVDRCYLLVVPCGHDLDKGALICASPLQENIPQCQAFILSVQQNPRCLCTWKPMASL